jgi:predicted phosphodiesterase
MSVSVNILVLNDIHAASSPPSGARDVWVTDVLDMLDQAREYARKFECQYTVLTGDLFHSKRNVPDWLRVHLIDLFNGWPGRKLAIVGNHDLGYEGLASIKNQPIGTLFASGCIEWLENDIVTVDYEDDNDATTTPLRIQWSPTNYFDAIDGDASKPPFENDNAAHYGLKRLKNMDWTVKVAHGMLVPPKQSYPYAFTPYSAVPLKGMDVMLYGHPHYDTGCVEYKGVWFCSYGSMGRVARTKENRERGMRLLMMKVSKSEIEREVLPLKSTPSDELFFEMEKDGVEITAPMERFARSVREALSSNDLGSLEDSIEVVGKGVDVRAKKRLVTYIERASA